MLAAAKLGISHPPPGVGSGVADTTVNVKSLGGLPSLPVPPAYETRNVLPLLVKIGALGQVAECALNR